MRAYLKSLVPALGTLIAVIGLYISSGEFDRAEIAVGTTGLITASLAYFTANVAGWGYLKALVPAFTTGVGVLGLLIESGTFDRTELSVLVTGLLSATLTYAVGNSVEPEPTVPPGVIEG